uniref:Uncharacterized protein n=1 Tax=Cajanus cajan TaxID=3821 RepID=A0A151SPD6_CAJCA|nr:hypothetical protein KK1_002897 [Cajanus cajan]
MIGRKKKAIFNNIKDRIWRKINHWSSKHLSKVGREILLKFVAQAIPSYCMSTFPLPTTLSGEIQKMMNSFWWGSNRNAGHGIHCFNLAMLWKQGWKFLTNQCYLNSRFQGKILPKRGLFGSSVGPQPKLCLA